MDDVVVENEMVSQSGDTGLIVFIIFCGILLIAVALIGSASDRKKRGQGVYGNLKKSSVLGQFYNFFSEFFLTRWYVAKVRSMYQAHCPIASDKLRVKTIKVCFFVWGSAAGVLYLVFMRNPTVYSFVLAVFLIAVVSIEILRFVSKMTEKRILRQLEKFLNDVRHFYYDTHSVVGAILEAASVSKYEMSVHAERLCEVLTAADVKDAVEEYNRSSANRFLKLFLSQCVATQEYGDTKKQGESLFVRNINDLRADILNYLLQLERLQMEFAGLTFITVLPVFALPAIKGLAVGALPELEAFYSGAFGVLAGPIYLVVTVLIYLVIVKMQELDAGETAGNQSLVAAIAKMKFVSRFLDAWEEKNYGRMLRQKERLRRAGERITPRQWLVQKAGFAIIAFVSGVWLFSASHMREREILCSNLDNVASLSSAATTRQTEAMKEAVFHVVNRYKDVEGVTRFILVSEIESVSSLNSEVLIGVTADECMRRILEYQDSYVKWYEILCVLSISVLAYCIPLFLIKYKESLMKMNMLSEVTTFQSIIMMQMYIPDITVATILMSLEQFALIFRADLQDCINELSFSWREALENMRDNEEYEPFRRLCDNFIIADKIGIQLAFDEIAQDREHFQKQRELDTSRMIKKKSERAKLIAFIPVVIIIATYLILPFAVESFNQFSVIMEELNMMQ